MMRDLQFSLHAVEAGPGRMEHRRTGSLSYEKWIDDSLLSMIKLAWLVIHVCLQYQI